MSEPVGIIPGLIPSATPPHPALRRYLVPEYVYGNDIRPGDMINVAGPGEPPEWARVEERSDDEPIYSRKDLYLTVMRWEPGFHVRETFACDRERLVPILVETYR